MLSLPAVETVRETFRRTGVVVVDDALDPGVASSLAAEAMALARRSSRHIRRSSDAGVLDYGVITGDVLRADAPQIQAVYDAPDLLGWIQGVTATPGVGRSPHVRSAVNVNILAAAGQQYRWHTDAVPFTVLLFLTTLAPGSGGELLVRTLHDGERSIAPAAGLLVLLDGHRCPHAVAPLCRDVPRVSVPMVFPAEPIERPAGLDDYLYAT